MKYVALVGYSKYVPIIKRKGVFLGKKMVMVSEATIAYFLLITIVWNRSHIQTSTTNNQKKTEIELQLLKKQRKNKNHTKTNVVRLEY